MAASKKRSREDFDANTDDNERLTESKKLRLSNNTNHAVVSQSSSIEMHDCTVVFSAVDPIITESGIHRWEAILKHNDYGSSKEAVLAKAGFSVMKIDDLSNFRDNLHEIEDWDAKGCFNDAVFIDSVEVHPDFNGYEYELCLVQRIIDNHVRWTDVVMIEYGDSMHVLCQKMKFQQCCDSRYRLRVEQMVDSEMKDYICFQPDSPQQPITSDLAGHYVATEETECKNDENEKIYECKNIDLSLCYVTFSSTQNATNTQLEEDFANFWTATLEYRPPNGSSAVRLANAKFWCVHHPTRFSSEELFYVMDAQCKELADLLSVMDEDGPFKLHKEDNTKNLRIRCKSILMDMMSNPQKWGKEYLDEDAAIQGLLSIDPLQLGTYYREMNEGGGGDIVYLDRVWVEKDYGGRKFGRCLVQIIINNHARGFDGVVLKPFPLQWENKPDKTEEEKREFKKAKKNVVSVWESMWFCPFGGPNSPYWGRSEAWKHPKMEIKENTITFKELY